nr:suppressor of gamma response 1-like [Tanacetum cinerariifolium]
MSKVATRKAKQSCNFEACGSSVAMRSLLLMNSNILGGLQLASKIRTSGACNPEHINWKSNPTKACPNCHHIVNNNNVNEACPGLTRGVKFDPLDHEIIWHLLAKSGRKMRRMAIDPVTPKSATPEPPRAELRVPDMGPKQELAVTYTDPPQENPYILSTLAPQLWPFMRHSITLVPDSAIRTLGWSAVVSLFIPLIAPFHGPMQHG